MVAECDAIERDGLLALKRSNLCLLPRQIAIIPDLGQQLGQRARRNVPQPRKCGRDGLETNVWMPQQLVNRAPPSIFPHGDAMSRQLGRMSAFLARTLGSGYERQP